MIVAFRNSRAVMFSLMTLCAIPTVRAEGLLSVYELAEQNDPQLQSAEAALRVVNARIPGARSAFLPQVSATGNDEHDRDDTSFTGVPSQERKFREYVWNVQLTQPVVQFDAYFAYREATALGRQAAAQYSLAKQDLILRTCQAYFNILLARDAVNSARRQEAATNEQLALADKGFKTGTHAVTDAYEAKSKAASSRAQRIGAESEVEKSIAEIEKIIGVPLDTVWPLPDDAVVPAVMPDNVREWADHASAYNPAVVAGQAGIDAAVEDIRKNRADHLPSVGLVASYGANYAGAATNNPADYSSFSRGRQAGVQVSIPIFSGGGIDAKVMEAVANRDKATADLETAKRQAVADARESYTALTAGIAQVEALQVAVESGESAVTGNERGYRLGIRINSDVLSAEQDLYANRRDLSKARVDALMQGLKLKAAAGTLSELDLIALDKILVHVETPIQDILRNP